MGRPEEYFWRWQEAEWASRFGVPAPDGPDFAAYVRAALQYGTTSNGVFGAKVFWAHAEDLIRRTTDIPDLAGLPGHQRFRQVFGGNLCRLPAAELLADRGVPVACGGVGRMESLSRGKAAAASARP